MAAATVTSKGQITIPAEVRRALGLRAGSRVAFTPTGTGAYELVPQSRTITALKGIVTGRAEPVSVEQMDAAISAAAAQSIDR